MRPLMPLALACSAFFLTDAVAQQHHNAVHPQHAASQQHHNSSSYAPMNFPNNGFNFPNNAINFPSNAINFPNNAINFPSYAGNVSTGMMNYSPYGNGFYGNYPSSPHMKKATNSQQGLNPQMSAANATAMMGFGIGVGSVYSAVPHHYHGHPQHYRLPYNSAGYGSYGTNNANHLTPAQRHYNKLVADLDSLPPHFQVADIHRNTIRNDMMALIQGGNRPSTATVQQLSHNLSNAMARRKSQAINTSMLAGDIQLVLNSAQVPQARIDQAMTQTQTVLKQGGFAQADIQTVVADMRAVADHLRTNQAAIR